ncbi:MAG: hypothetical protein ACI9JN_000165 [Bacteroidia bacterium]|jgi:hypothetical protein
MKNILLITALFAIVSCASIDLPPGGTRDVTPPKIVTSSPDSAETIFTGNQIKITFDEYFSLNNLNKALIVSPPLETTPKTVVKGKNLYLNLNEPLKPNITYQFYFDDGIKDLNEGNKTKNLRLVFSTGPNIDTAYISGMVKSAFDHLPIDGIKVFLYKEYKDSQLITDIPFYITKTNKEGTFSFENIAEGTYYCYALKDENNNNKLDINESFSFLKTLLPSNTSNHTLLLSVGNNSQELDVFSHKEISKGQFVFIFNKPFVSKQITISSKEHLIEISKNKTLPWHYGVTKDSVYVYINTSTTNDTIPIQFKLYGQTIDYQLNLKAQNLGDKNLEISAIQKPNKPIKITTNYAVRKTKDQDFLLFNQTDSTPVIIDSTILHLNTIKIYSKLKEAHSYNLELKNNAITFYDGETNAIDTFSIQTQAIEKTGELVFNVVFDSSLLGNGPYFFCLTKNKTILEQPELKRDTIISVNYINPGTYKAYIFLDADEDKNWSDANYITKQQAELIWHVNSPIEARSKWKTKGITLYIK